MVAGIGPCQRSPTSNEMLLEVGVAVAASTQEGREPAGVAQRQEEAALDMTGTR